MPVSPDIIEALRLELRRGTLILAVLGALRAEKYGYTLRAELEELGVDIDEGALYPMLRRLETQGLLTSEWREDAKRQKRFYRLSPDGAAALEKLSEEWRALNRSLDSILDAAPPSPRALKEGRQ
jgi:DNA-binding PadR family transcriptional regulator